MHVYMSLFLSQVAKAGNLATSKDKGDILLLYRKLREGVTAGAVIDRFAVEGMCHTSAREIVCRQCIDCRYI